LTGTPSQLTLLYTAHLADHLAALPRLFTLIQSERRAAPGPVFVLDLGDSCSPQSWICRATQGRAGLMILDGMGFDAAVIGGRERVPIPAASLQRLRDRLVMPLIEWHTLRELSKRDVRLAIVTGDAALPPGMHGFRVDRTKTGLARGGDGEVVVGDVPGGALGRVIVTWPAWTVESADVLELPGETPPDPTIAAIMELVEHEARLFAQQQGGIP
jgi:hypothetical protein